MNNLNLTKLTDAELEIELKKRKQGYVISAFIVGMMFGCAAVSIAAVGFSFYILVPFIFAYWFRNAKNDFDEVKKEIETRN